MSTPVAAPPDSPHTTPALPASAHRARRWWVAVGVVVLALVVTMAFAGAWYFSGQINHEMLDATSTPITYDLTATPLGTDAVRVSAPSGASLSDGLTSARVYAIRSVDQVWQLGAPTSAGAGWVVRPRLAGDPTLTSATKVNAYREMWLTPTDLGRPFQTVPVTSALGTFHDWFVPAANATGSTWLVMVHGKGGTKAEGLRVLSAVTPLHLPALLIGYRNDEGGPTTNPQRYTYGVQDWPDVAASVQYALAHGASNVVLVGFSYGGSLVASFMSHSDLAGHVSGIVLDSPMLDAQQTVRYGASQRSLPLIGTSIPSSLVWTSMQVSRLRFGSDWYHAGYLTDPTWLRVPLLIYQGSADAKIPLSFGRDLSTARPDLVTYVVTPGAEHVGSWNSDPRRYDAMLRTFLTDTLGCRSAGSTVTCTTS